MNAVATADLPLQALVVECGAGGLARAAGRTPEPTPGSGLLDMARWKEIVDAAAADTGASLAVLFFGEANLVTGYRLYYLLRYAVHAGLRNVTLITDGRFWIDEATTWLLECGVHRIAIVDQDAADGIEAQIASLTERRDRDGLAAPAVMRLVRGSLSGAQTIDWRGRAMGAAQ